MAGRGQPSPLLRARAEALGEPGRAWLDGLPTAITELENRWNVRAGAVLEGGSASHVLDVVTADGERAILKLGLPGSGFVAEIDALVEADGRGYVRVLESDRARSALLLEPLGTSLNAASMGPDAKLAILGNLIRQGWRTTASADAFSLQDKAAELGAAIAEFRLTLDHGCDEAVFATCEQYASKLSDAFSGLSPVLLHGDAAAANVLEVPRPRPGADLGWVFVDPEPFVGDPAYDLGVAARDWNGELLAAGDGAADLLGHYCAVLGQASGADPQQIWEWAYLERVSTGLFVLSFGADEYARPFFESAERILT